MYKKDVLKYFGTMAAVIAFYRENRFKITQPSISAWPEIIPEVHARRLADLTKGRSKNKIRLKFDATLYQDAK